MLSGPVSSGKLTCALETARILSCRASVKGNWDCTCSSCLQHKALINSNTILLGSRDCCLEISASKKAFLNSVYCGEHIEATRYLFIRSIRKLTMRFNQIIWQDSDKLSKISKSVEKIDEILEEIDPPHQLPETEKLVKKCNDLEKYALELENDLLYDSISISHIRNISSWAHISIAEGKKVIIIEKAERMLEGVRNALLKILEEPPENVLFILTTSNKSSVMPTILSRVRPYNFVERNSEQVKEIINRVYHEDYSLPIEKYLQEFLPLKSSEIKNFALDYYSKIVNSQIPDVAELVKNCNKFDPEILFKIFLESLYEIQKKSLFSSSSVQASSLVTKAITECWNNYTIYNQSVTSCLENLAREISVINKQNYNCLRETV